MIERVLSLIAQNGNSDYSLEKEIGLAQGTISNWRVGRNKVSTDAIIKLAKYFNVSADYLLCLSDMPKPLDEEKPTPDVRTLSPQEAKLIDGFRRLDKTEKSRVEEYVALWVEKK